ncbi:phage/plasmid primase, P4 family [Stenotrophomonas pavanii]|uniref:phage/plasmid primase, P4 family n=1 Tax=Gammaproteobacteria TaxID=1236 RepID=UPI00249F7455|nr:MULTISPECIES: phage/plasmid primase, P4 family [Gammaproteobacteria]MDI4092169.1 phage/plasmid primase, P4 family [Pseudomonas aeruginosa]MDY1446122.1 phage/plasmid primase, P4 family [Pseudomonas aeruginosa]MDZ7475216.1 phage/plasmid primase, P4 family [Stenotrophomonas pavanii]
MLDFNDTQTPVPRDLDAEREAIRAELLARVESVLAALFPAGRKRGGKFLIGDVLGSPGDSLEIVLDGEKAGLWTDRATGDGGDIFALIAAHLGIGVLHDFPRVLDAAADLLGRSRSAPARKTSKKNAPVDELGPATAKWDYLDEAGHLIAVVYRYDPPGQKKQFRPWDAKRRKMTPPDPRPLYNQPGMASAAQVVLVEGEKCAQALIDAGIVATTAMHGANAPVDKTDWSPLSGKSVLIWPDRDKPGWEYATLAAQAILSAGAKSCHILYPPEEAAEGWDAADAIAEGFDVATFLTHGPRLQMHDVADDVDPVVSSDESVWGTEDALALSFTRRYHRDWRYVAAWGRWLVWDGQRWRTEDTLAATDLIRSVCRQTAVRADDPKIAAKLASASTVGGVERLARADRRHAATTDEWDADPWLLNTPGGVVDLMTGRMRPHDRADRMTKITTATPSGDCPTWKQFIDEVTGGDKELQAYLQRMVGYALTGSTQEHALFFLYGTGANGKSVFVNTLATILGDYATNAPMDTFMETRTDRHPTDMAGLRGARFVAAIETEQGKRWAESKLKNLTGGDKIAARFMRQDFFEFFPQFKLFVAGNHKPAIRNIDEAMKRRLHLIPFTITVPPERRDKNLQHKLLAERDGILAWAVQGCLDWQRHGRLDPPQRVVDATEEYFEAEDALGRWLDERCVRTASAKSLTAELFSDWKLWADAAGEFTGSQKRFADLLLNRGLDKWRNGMGLRGFQGIGLKYPPAPAYTPYADD